MLSHRSTQITGLLTILLYARSQIAPSSLIGSPIAPLSNARKMRLLRLLRRASAIGKLEHEPLSSLSADSIARCQQ